MASRSSSRSRLNVLGFVRISSATQEVRRDAEREFGVSYFVVGRLRRGRVRVNGAVATLLRARDQNAIHMSSLRRYPGRAVSTRCRASR